MHQNKWIWQGKELEEIPDKAIGFVYIITNKISGKKYIGKKLFHSSKTIQKNKKKKRVKVESDWQQYFGSNETLKNLVYLNGEEYFSREILHICYSKSQCSYFEIKEQLIRDVILSEEYYNDWISAKITRRHMQKFKL